MRFFIFWTQVKIGGIIVLDIKFIRNNVELVTEALEKRNAKGDIDNFLKLDKSRRELIAKSEQLKKTRNEVSQEIGKLKRAKEDITHLTKEMKEVGQAIKKYDIELKDVEERLNEILLGIPNIPNEDVPVGQSDEDNREIRRWGEARDFDFRARALGVVGGDFGY